MFNVDHIKNKIGEHWDLSSNEILLTDRDDCFSVYNSNMTCSVIINGFYFEYVDYFRMMLDVNCVELELWNSDSGKKSMRCEVALDKIEEFLIE
jgi:hypothetical protein